MLIIHAVEKTFIQRMHKYNSLFSITSENINNRSSYDRYPAHQVVACHSHANSTQRCLRGYAPSFIDSTGCKKRLVQLRQPLFVPPLGIEPGPSEPESEILSFKLQGHSRLRDCKVNNFR